MLTKTELQGNNLDLRTILDMVNNLPNKGSGTGEDISEEVDTIESLTEQIKLALEGKAAGGGKIFAAIGVTYPEDSVCTCTNGTKTMEAGNTNGQWVFAIPEAGEWTVTSTDGINEKSQSVSITKEGQFESMALSYQLILFDGGDNTTVTGGWKADGHGGPTAVVGTTVGLNINASGKAYEGKSFIVATKNTIDMSGYTKLCATITNLSATEGKVRVVSEINSNATAKASVDAKLGTVEVDISSLNSGKVGLWIIITANAYGVFSGSISASKIWLE